MRSYHFILAGLLLLFVLEVTAAGGLVLDARQDENTSVESSEGPATTSAGPSRTPSATAPREESASETAQSDPPEKTLTDAPASKTIAVTESVSKQTAPTISSNAAQPSGTASPESANPLPIQPRITPAMGIAGAILLISGAVYAVIGIKNKTLYISFSAAYLTSLAVSVLIVYLMTPPVSDAAQGGFFVAALLTGVVFGGVSLVFSDITDGLGCLLGGFCLSMWFLSLKEGGLIKSTTGRAIFIGCMSAAAYTLSFSHYTRSHGLIVSISFAGATITMLGIDCFSRAGWKEFWLYIWGLNMNIFPLETNTYPITRGIKVEVAGVVLLTVFGIMSQLKLWKIVKKRREKNAEARAERDQELRREEEEVGRRVRDDFTRERVQWEAAYGGSNQQQDSVIDSSQKGSPKTSMSTREKDISSGDSVEMVSIPLKQSNSVNSYRMSPTNKHTTAGPTVAVESLREEDEIRQAAGHGTPALSRNSALTETANTYGPPSSGALLSSETAASGEEEAPKTVSTRSSIQTPASTGPVVIPLPFTVPKEEDVRNEDIDTASVSVAVESVYEGTPNRRSSLKRLSGGSLLKRFSVTRTPTDGLEEALIVPHIEDDRASSIAATLDDDDTISLAEMSVNSSQNGTISRDGLKEGNGSSGDDAPSHRASIMIVTGEKGDCSRLGPTLEKTQVERQRTPQLSLTLSTDPIGESAWAKGATFSSSPLHPTTDVTAAKDTSENGQQTKIRDPESLSPPSQEVTPNRLSKDVLPDKVSKVVLSYRTNEWAKHLEQAEQPEPDALPEPESPGVKVFHNDTEQLAPANDELSELPAARMMPKRTSTGNNPYRNSNLIRSTSNMSRQSLTGGQTAGPSRPVSGILNAGRRSSSSPLQSTEMLDTAALRLSNTPSPAASNTLLGQRETLVRNKVSSQSLTPYSSTQNLSQAPDVDLENLTLAQRKKLIQQQKPRPTSQQRRQSNRIPAEQIQGFDSHQPRRVSGGVDPSKREVLLAGWRESMRQDGLAAQAQPTTADDERSRREALIKDKRQKEIEQREQAMKAQQRESMLGNMMRSGDMLDAHREAMRRMQAKANRNAS